MYFIQDCGQMGVGVGGVKTFRGPKEDEIFDQEGWGAGREVVTSKSQTVPK